MPSPNDLLCDCSQWPTMLALTQPAHARLDALVRQTRDADRGLGARRKDVLSGLILHADETPSILARLSVDLRNPKYAGPLMPDSRLTILARERMVVTLPSPVSMRLNHLVDLARTTGLRAHRTNLVVGLIWTAPKSRKRIAEWAHDGRCWRAAQAAIDGEPVESVLRSRPPKPGPRPGNG